MHFRIKYIRYSVIFLLLISCVQQLRANTDNPIVTVLDGSHNQIAKDSIATSVDSLFFSGGFASNLVKPYPVQDVITFHINEQSLIVLPSSFTAVVHLKIYYRDSSNHSDSLNDLRLAINYTATSSYTARSSFVFSGAYGVQIKVLSDTIASTVIGALMIENEIIPSRKYTFSCSGKAIQTVNLVGHTPDELTVSWSNIVGIDQVDLEWAFIDSSALASGLYTVSGSYNPNLIFTNNATRVSVSTLNYNIPLIFSGPGSVFVRVRTAQVNDKGKRITSQWSSDYLPGGMLKYDFGGHENNLNWQSSVSFAEDGKRKVVVQYFDGSLRSRQTVTKDNTSNTTVTAETFYDYQGRPAIQVLPAPSINTIIKYTANFNRVNGAEYDKSVFDSVIAPQTACGLVAPAMDSGYGAAWYYSANNTYVGNGVNRYIPEAYGYAFSQTEYTQDNTGRVAKQGGVGQEFKLGSGHETKYYYSVTPDQNELDALFGTEAGDHTHYFKNAVRDADSQYSVSYVDMHGRTIATALAGDSTGGLARLSYNTPASITQTLADASTNVTDGNSMTSHKSLLVTKEGSQHFVYSLSPQSFQQPDCSSTNICYDCLYDLTITLTDDCNNSKNSTWGGHPLVIRRPNISIADAICNGSSIAVDTSFSLVQGEYQVTKTLTVNQAAENDYLNNVYIPHNTCKTLSDFITTQEEALPHGNCTVTCASCRAGIGSYADFSSNYMTKVYGDTAGTALHSAEIDTAYNNALASCDSYCNDTVYDKTDYVKQAMLFDVSPKSGQYANLDSAVDTYSIFYPSSSPYYQSVHDYKDETGTLDSAWDNVYGKKVPPEQLDPKQFAEDFKPSWANSLLSHHPEFCKLQAYQHLYNAYTWEKKFNAITSYSQAIALGYADPIGAGLNHDPLMDETVYNFATPLSTKYDAYDTSMMGTTKVLSMWNMAVLNVKCPQGDTACIQNIVFATYPDYTLPACGGDSNQAWRNFQQLYIAYRNELLDNYYLNLSTCTITAQQLLDDHHFLNFGSSGLATAAGGLGYTSSTNEQEIKDSGLAHMQAAYQSNCEAYDTLWAQQLQPGYLGTQINQILPLLVDVCVAGADQDHPYGSRTINPANPLIDETIGSHTYSIGSFTDVITAYNTEYSIATTLSTNADVISVPAPYNAGPIYTKTIVNNPDANECESINFYKEDYDNNKLTGETFSQYLKRTQNTDISDDDLNTLLNACVVSPTCNYLDHPVSLPAIFQTTAGSNCTDCYLFGDLVSQYIGLYGDTLYPVLADQTDTLQQRKNTLFTNFMNNQLGYNLSINDYLNFMNQCSQFGGGESFSGISDSTDSLPPQEPMLCGRQQPAFPVISMDTVNSCMDSTFFAVSTGTELYNHYQDSLKNAFDSIYRTRCLQAYNYESFTVTSTVSEYHYTLYYYDQAGNLVQTIPPRAVHPNWDATYLAQVKTKRASGDTLRPGHDLTLATEYRYNTLNQVISQKSPDGGSSSFYYDRLGRLVLSQNAKQAPSSKYSYTTYDPLGRITEVGELTNSAAMNGGVSKTDSLLQTWLTNANTSRTQITHTTYDTVYYGIDSLVLTAKNLRNRVSYLQYFNTASDQAFPKPQASTYYSYDIEGNVDTLVQDYIINSLDTPHNRFFKRIVYGYDLISGKVNTVDYNPGQPDAFHHRYTYDAENRLTNTETSIDSIYWENEAFSKYYYHGPLARTILGELQVQGVDYAYTLQGWLKGINTTDAGTVADMGNDGFSAPVTANQYVGRDAYGFALHYFGTDYKPINSSVLPFAKVDNTVLSDFKPLYNGNIAAMSENQTSFAKPLLFSYGYDQLNRLVQMRTYKNSTSNFASTNAWTPAAINDYNEDVTYDPNGNILKYKRYGNSTNTGLTNALLMDSLNYFYKANTNQLDRIKDSVAASRFSVDIDNQNSNNYRYDAIGDLTYDSTGGIDSISWTVYGKIQKINKHDGTVINFSYDASGNRISKIVTGASSGNGETWYVHDASGNIMTIYTVHDNTVNSGALTLSEQDIYGSSRLGIYKPKLNLITYTQPHTYMNTLGSVGYSDTFTRGQKFFELTNHLGNVLVTVSDKKVSVGNNGGIIDHYTADIISASDYYPFGMQTPGRDTLFKTAYRYGFNGKESDNEPYGQGNEYDYGFRIYNPRIGKFLSVDPLTKKYPELTPFQFASNSPVSGVDLDGLEYYYTPSGSLVGKYGTSTEVRVVNADFIKNNYGKSVLISEWNKNSRDVGITNEELNTRAFMSTLKQTENGGNSALPYNAKHGFTKGKLNTFTDKSYEEAPQDYAKHPYEGKTGPSAAGAYQILAGSWKNDRDRVVTKIRDKYGITDFSPQNQDKLIIGIIDIKRKALDDVETGNINESIEKLKLEWSSLPGGSQSHGLTEENFQDLYKNNVSNELNNKTNLALPQGQTLNQKKP